MTSLNKTGHNIPGGGILEVPNSVMYADMLLENLKKYPNSICTRCKKEFAQLTSKQFKRCNHCRELQRLRTKRWQTETRQKEGVCSRCRTALTDSSFSLCQKCRVYLRNNKETRLLKGKCVHCSAPNEENDIYKVCKRCRLKDKARRLTLERESVCVQCRTVTQTANDGKRCYSCKSKQIPVTKSFRSCIENDLYVDSSEKCSSNDSTRNQLCNHKRGSEFDRELRHKQQRIDSDCIKVDYCSEGVNVNVSDYDDQSLEDKILETFTLHHDHAQLNQQLKRLSQYTNGDNDSIDDDVSKYTSVLVDFHGLDDIGITYDIENVDDINTNTKIQRVNQEVENEGGNVNNVSCEDSLNLDIDDGDNDNCNDNDNDDDGDDDDDDDDEINDGDDNRAHDNYNTYGENGNASTDCCNIDYTNNSDAVLQLQQSYQKKKSFDFQDSSDRDNATKETMLFSAQSIRERMLTDDTEPSEAEITAAVQAVAAAAAAVVESNRLKG